MTDAHRREPWSTPETWGPLEIRERIGAGAFGEVFRAWDPRLEREVALKLFRPDRSPQPRTVTGAVEEGRLLAQVQHPNVVGVYGAEVHDDRCGVWMELVDGITRGPFGVREQGIQVVVNGSHPRSKLLIEIAGKEADFLPPDEEAHVRRSFVLATDP